MVSAGAQTLVYTSQTNPSQPPAATTTVQAASASDFLNSIGVACHFDYFWTPYNNFSGVEALLLQSGIRNVRDGGTDPTAVSSFRALHNSGIDVTWVMDAIDGVAPTSAYWTTAPHYTLPSFLENVLGTNAISAIEISNEIDIYYGSIKWHQQDQAYLSDNPRASNYWGSYIQSLVQDTSAVVRQDPALASILLIGTSFGLPWAGVPAGAFYSFVDQGAIHPYMYRGNASVTNGTAYDGVPHYLLQSTETSVLIDEYPIAISNFDSPYQRGNQQKPLVVTETGYYTGLAPYSIDELTHAKYVPRIFAEYFRHGISKTFVYEFVDEGADGGMENSFGLVRADLTPKPAYTALQSMIGLLQDSGGQFSPSQLTYGFNPGPDQSYTRLQYAHDLLLEKSDGDFFLLFWQDISDANRVDSNGNAITGTDPDVNPDALPVQITLPSNILKATLYTYDGNWQLQASPVSINSSRILVQSSDELQILRLQTASTLPSTTATTLRSSSSQITAGQSFSLSATVAASDGSTTPSGMVSFYLGQANIGTATLAGGVATLSVTSSFSPGTYNLTATYNGSTGDDASTSSPVQITIAPAGVATTTTLRSSASQLTAGQSFSLSATVAASSGSGTPSGTVSVYLGQTNIGTAPLAGGVATLSATGSFSPGTYNLTASYAGSSGYDASNSPPVTITIASTGVATTTTLRSSASQLAQGQPFSLSATVATSSGSGRPSGIVSFYLGQNKIGAATLAGGLATLSATGNFSPGTYNLTASYAGSSGYDASNSEPVAITIAPIVVATTTSLSITPQQPVAAQSMTMQVNVRTTVSGSAPSGMVTLYLDGSPIDILTLVGDTGGFTMGTPQAGPHTAFAVFDTQGDYLTSQSKPVNFTVQPASKPQSEGSFEVALSSASVSMSMSNPQPASLQVAVSTSGNYSGSIQLSCAGLPAGINCNFSPASLTINATNATSTLVLTGQAVQTATGQMAWNLENGFLFPWEMLSVFGIACRRQRRRGSNATFLILGLLCSILFTTGCGLTINNVTRSYSVTVTAIDQNHVTETTTFTLKVTQPGMTP